jgi:hypothetical protein
MRFVHSPARRRPVLHLGLPVVLKLRSISLGNAAIAPAAKAHVERGI